MADHYFIGIPISESLQKNLRKWQEELRKSMNYKVWTHEKDFHITLKFLGASADEKIEELKRELANVKTLPSFNVTIGPAGSFGQPKQPRVFHAGVEKHAALIALQEMVETAAVELGWEKEKRAYTPHVTIAKKGAEGLSPLLINENKLFDEQFEEHVNQICLYRIHPKQKQKYEAVATIWLNEEE
ncbi:RNA 2',3'-cyclic phosphodiesterase [Halobacillus litoralis]|uniref:RNA 2',3'-cyclic phosphodiesterase n=1 Tax=Halobacillus litoralis TaxID=45668 RepID=UPI001CD701D4|nr:RNA 2',3'-cyclic phosphodiesterase [Halobacillus litoralis]MCA0972751.1 RNA 2',3'-cyclic phosphodiesterase [Halobacillus litoralis]